MATPPRHVRGGGKASSRDEDRLSDPLRDRDLARRTGGLAQHARRWQLWPGSPWMRVVLGIAVLVLLLLVMTGARAQDGFVPVPPHAARVTDQAGMLNASQRAALDGVLADYERKTGSQIAVLLVKSTAPERVYRHTWSVGDVVIWDNRGVLHRACPYDPSSPRDMHRTTFTGDEPIQ